MNEDIRKNEIPEEELESAAGGAATSIPCSKCGGIDPDIVSDPNLVLRNEFFYVGREESNMDRYAG